MEPDSVEKSSYEPTQGKADDILVQLDDEEALEAVPRGDPFRSGSALPLHEQEALGDAGSDGFAASGGIEVSETASPSSSDAVNDVRTDTETSVEPLSAHEARQAPEGDIAESPGLPQHAPAPVSANSNACHEEASGSADATSPACESNAAEPTSTQPRQPAASASDGERVASAADSGDVEDAEGASPPPDVPEPDITELPSTQPQLPPAEVGNEAHSSSPAENGDFGDFGDFGGFEDARPADDHPTAAIAPSSTHPAEASRDAASMQPPLSASPAQHASASSNTPNTTTFGDDDDDFGDFGDFGDFEDAPAASSSATPPPDSAITATTTTTSSWVLPPSQQPPAGAPAAPAADATPQECGNILLLKDAAFLSEVLHRWAHLPPPAPPAGSPPQAAAPAALLSALRSRARAGGAARNTVIACNGLPLESVARSASSAAGASSAYATDSKLQWKGTPAEARLLELLGLRGSAAAATSQDSLRTVAGGSALVPGQSEAQDLLSMDSNAASSGSSLSWSSYEASTAAPFAMPSSFPGYKPQDLLL